MSFCCKEQVPSLLQSADTELFDSEDNVQRGEEKKENVGGENEDDVCLE